MAITLIRDVKGKTLPLGARWQRCTRCPGVVIRYAKFEPFICDRPNCYEKDIVRNN